MISICLCTFNGEAFLRSQLESIFKQKDSKFISEIIICDDKSTDSTLKIIEEFSKLSIKLKLIINKKRLGVIKNFEKCLSYTNYPIIIFCDQDDIWDTSKVTKILKIKELQLKKPIALVHNAAIIDDKEEIIRNDFMEIRGGFSSEIIKNFYKNRYLGCCLIINSNLKKMILPFPNYLSQHDIWIGIVASLYGKTFFINENLTLYRQHKKNASKASKNERSRILKIFKFRLIFIYNVFIIQKRIIKFKIRNISLT